MNRSAIVVLSIGLLASSVSESAAQLSDVSARSLALGGSFTARAEGYEVLFWNPANLGLPGQPGWSVGLPTASAHLGNNSLSYSEITSLYGTYLDDQRKSEILAGIRGDEPSRMFQLESYVGAHLIGFNIGRFAFGGGTIGSGDADLSSDAVELVLFGNAGEDGTGKDFALQGSEALGWSVSAAGVSYAHPFELPAFYDTHFSAGITGKYLLAHPTGRLLDRGTSLTQQPLALDASAEVLYSDNAISGHGWAADIAVALQTSTLTAGLVIQNIIGDIAWDESAFELTLVGVSADFTSSVSTDTTFTFDELSAEDQERVREFLGDAQLARRLRLGGVLGGLPAGLSVSLDFEQTMGGRLSSGWDRRLSGGVELQALSFLPLRVGLATNLEDFAYSAGLGLYAGPVHLDLAVRRQGVPSGDGMAGAVGISVWPGM